MNSQAEENYLKAIYKLSRDEDAVSTSALAAELGVQAATVTDMLKKLSSKGRIAYKRYHGTALTDLGRKEAVRIIRKHRLWETFLVEKLGFNWGDVHEVAEQLEHVNSEQLIDRLEAFLGNPKTDPHGDPIPTKEGQVERQSTLPLSELHLATPTKIAQVKDDGKDLLSYLEKHGMLLGSTVEVLEKLDFDGSLRLLVSGKEAYVSDKIASNILVFSPH